ncbi:cold-shock protein [Paenibacillus puerhi]|uniref:cold-shock protein n=1 Tax=Paenibacillus puerhi TaxID=2692622 RepID=UPI00135BD49F|nr:cold-shock protein [Paenibacillus puerhi]
MNFRKRSLEDIPEETTAIWACSREGCKGWMRDNFAFAVAPTCVLCGDLLVGQMKMLPIIVNTNRNLKSLKKGVQIS